MTDTSSVTTGPSLVVVRTRPDGTSTKQEVSRAVASNREALAGAVAADPALCEVRRGEIVEVTADERVARPVEVLAMLRTVGHHAPEDPERWDAETAEAWTEIDESGIDTACGFDAVPRWVSVNGQRATGVVCGPASRRRLHLVLLDADEDDVVPLPTITGAWYVDNDMSMVGGSGGQALSLVAHGVLLQTVGGDASGPKGVLPWPTSTRARAALVARWVDAVQVHVPAALCLETLDTSRLSASATQRWEDLVASTDVGFSIEGDGELVDAVRSLLRRTSGSYRDVRRALGAPRGERGRALRACLEAVLNSERPVADLLYGGWTEPPRGAAERAAGYDTTWVHYDRYMAELRARGVR